VLLSYLESRKTRIKRIEICAYCSPGTRHIIDPDNYPNDKNAFLAEKGWQCGNCVEREADDIFLSTALYSDPKRLQEIREKRKREEDKRRKLEEINRLVQQANAKGGLVR
jgi:hypothetical protein